MFETAKPEESEVKVLPVSSQAANLVEPTAMSCLRCQLIGRRRLLCSKADACKALPHVFALGPVLLAGWIALALAFLLAAS